MLSVLFCSDNSRKRIVKVRTPHLLKRMTRLSTNMIGNFAALSQLVGVGESIPSKHRSICYRAEVLAPRVGNNILVTC
jgi:hypothetical protein